MTDSIRRRGFLGACCAGGAGLWAARGLSQEAKLEVSTHTYKRVGSLEIKADVHRPADDKVRPVVVWIHGGALINGSRAGVSGRVMKMAAESGWALVSIDYRLAPETKLPAIIEDLEDAFRWIRQRGPELFRADTSRIVVMGGSAGGYLTLTAGFRVQPRPTALVAFWGYGDLVGDWLSKPSPHPRHQVSLLDKQKAWQQVSGPAVSDSRQRQGNGGAFYQYCRRTGTWPQAVSGWDPRSEAAKISPYMPVKNVTPNYPPTLLIHGTKDTDVPHEQSTMMAAELKRHGVQHELISIAGGEHGLGGGDRDKIDDGYRRAHEFAQGHLQKPERR